MGRVEGGRTEEIWGIEGSEEGEGRGCSGIGIVKTVSSHTSNGSNLPYLCDFPALPPSEEESFYDVLPLRELSLQPGNRCKHDRRASVFQSGIMRYCGGRI